MNNKIKLKKKKMNNSPCPESSLFQGQIRKHLKMRSDSQIRVEKLIVIVII